MVKFDAILGKVRENDSLDSYTKEQIDEFLSKRVKKVSDFATYTPEYNGEIVQYIGESDENYTKGLFYQVTISESTYGINTERSRNNINSRVKLDINSFNNAFHERYGESVAIYAEYDHTQPTGWKDVNRQILVQVADPNVERYDSILKFDQSICEIFTDAEAFRNTYGANIQFASSGDGGGSGSGFVIEILSEPTTTWNAIKVQKTQIADVDGLQQELDKVKSLPTFELVLNAPAKNYYTYPNHTDYDGSNPLYPYSIIPSDEEVLSEDSTCKNVKTHFQELFIKLNLSNSEIRTNADKYWIALSRINKLHQAGSMEQYSACNRRKRWSIIQDQPYKRVPYVKYVCWFCSNNNYYYYAKVTSNDNPTEVDLNAYVYWNAGNPQTQANFLNITNSDDTFSDLLEYGITLESITRREENDLNGVLYEWYSISTDTYYYTHGNTEEYNPNNNEYLYYDAEDVMSQLHDNFCNYEHFGFRDEAASENDYEYTGNIIHQFTMPVAYAFKDSQNHYIYFTECEFEARHPEAYWYEYMVNNEDSTFNAAKATTLNCLIKQSTIQLYDGSERICEFVEGLGFTYSPEDNIYEYVDDGGFMRHWPNNWDNTERNTKYADAFPIRPVKLTDCKIVANGHELDFNSMTDEIWNRIANTQVYFKLPYNSYYLIMRELKRYQFKIVTGEHFCNHFTMPALCHYGMIGENPDLYHAKWIDKKIRYVMAINLYSEKPELHKNNDTCLQPIIFKLKGYIKGDTGTTVINLI